MKPKLSSKALQFKRKISPVRQIMSYADKGYIKNIGLNPKNLICMYHLNNILGQNLYTSKL